MELANKNNKCFELVIVGATPGGIAAAIAAARLGCNVAVVEAHRNIGGMMTSGLSKSDVEQKRFIGGIFREFTDYIWKYYRNVVGPRSSDLSVCKEGYYYEPSVAEKIMREMITETDNITLLMSHKVNDVVLDNSCIHSICVSNESERSQSKLTGNIFIDATYEGDLYAKAGADYRLGREGSSEFEEPHAGVIYYDYENGVILPKSTGEPDDGIQAYTYRFCLTTDPENSFILQNPPPNYDRNLYVPYFNDLEVGRLGPPKEFHENWGYYPEHFNTLMRALSVTDLPNSKVDANINPRPLAFPFPEENKGYVEGGARTRKRIASRHREISLGLLWFLQNDKDVPKAHREMAQQYNLPLDEFTDNDHFPFQLYVREARRLKGEYTITEHDVAITDDVPEPMHHRDTIAMGEFPIDSFPVHKQKRGDNIVLEGYLGMLNHITQPYEIPYRAMLPQQIDGLLVPVALSATHVGFSSVRMEPTWMALGQAAGTAAYVSIKHQRQPRHVLIAQVRRLLEQQGQVLRDK